MNRINVIVEETLSGIPISDADTKLQIPPLSLEKRAKNYALKVLQYLNKDRWDLSVFFCGNESIKKLNLLYRKKNEATDVLSFALGETRRGRFLPGDIAISLEALAENAVFFKVPQDEELRRLLIHGILHLDGMDHKSNMDYKANIEHKNNKEAEPMLQLQEKILANLAGERIL